MSKTNQEGKEEVQTSELLRRLQSSVEELLVSSLRKQAVSLSSHNAKLTDNRYQTVQLDDRSESVFRSGERTALAGLQLQNRTIIDLGCNLGEICRDAVKAGAKRAVGVEYDPYFIQMARYITAYNSLNSIDFHEVDLTQASTYNEQYDIVVALSVYAYIKEHIALIARMTRRVLVLETHAIDENWEQNYLLPLQRHFEHVVVADMSDHKARNKTDVRLLLFASHSSLDGALARRARDVSRATVRFTVDTTRSHIAFYDAFFDQIGVTRDSFTLDQLIGLSAQRWPNLTVNDVVEDVKIRGTNVHSPLYWASFLQGYTEAENEGQFALDNFYFRTFQGLISADAYSGALNKLMENPARAAQRLALRYKMIRNQNENDGLIGDPVILYTIVDKSAYQKEPYLQLHFSPAEETVYPIAVDGYHRLFLSYAMGLRNVPVLPMWSPGIPPVRKALGANPALARLLWSSVYSLSQKF